MASERLCIETAIDETSALKLAVKRCSLDAVKAKRL
jgi:hypothetical protein